MRALFLAAVAAWAGPARAAGTAGGRFLELGATPRASAMGEASAAAADGADAVRLNPAALLRVSEQALTLMHVTHLEDTALEHVAYGRRLAGERAAGLSLLYMDYGSIAKTDATGAAAGSAKPTDLAATLAYAAKPSLPEPLRGGSLGLSLSLVQSKIASSAQTFTGSVGFLSRSHGTGGWRFAFVGDHLFGQLKFDRSADPLPTTFRLGAAGHVGAPLLSLEFVLPKDADAFPALGLEHWFGDARGGGIAVRAGYNGRSAADLDGMAGLSAGLGFALGLFGVDYAFAPFGDLGVVHRLALTARLGRGAADDREVHPAPVLAAPPPPEPVLAGPPSPAKPAPAPAEAAPPPADAPTVVSLQKKGGELARAGDIKAAKESYLAAIALAKRQGGSPAGFVDAYLGLAWCLEHEGNRTWAVRNYERALELTADEKTKARIQARIDGLKAPAAKARRRGR